MTLTGEADAVAFLRLYFSLRRLWCSKMNTLGDGTKSDSERRLGGFIWPTAGASFCSVTRKGASDRSFGGLEISDMSSILLTSLALFFAASPLFPIFQIISSF